MYVVNNLYNCIFLPWIGCIIYIFAMLLLSPHQLGPIRSAKNLDEI
jgi:hypothetical protein